MALGRALLIGLIGLGCGCTPMVGSGGGWPAGRGGDSGPPRTGMDAGTPLAPSDPKVPGSQAPIGTDASTPPSRDASAPTDTGLGPIGPMADAMAPADECASLGYLGRCDGDVS